MDGGIERLGLLLRATCRERSVAHFRLHFVSTSHYYVYRRSQPFIRIYYLRLGNTTKVKLDVVTMRSIANRQWDMFRKPFYYFIPSLVAIVRGIIPLMRFALYCSCLGFGLASDYRHRRCTEFCTRYSRRKDLISPGQRGWVELMRSREKHLVVGSCSVPYILWDMIKHFVVRLA